ncbi:LuxR C-terminal-related transcriptional regulator [Gordonia sp. ABSL11-1]|uniref:helix-turn-helix transcriptional regulator n=1 Tax=Gordonia sp. ABSL11-1 TaxID=3053924 RepID=UPI00257230FB|nr:LuxR C-terminal-related transcriptional regulator [Gordonia sp. ABSL11-1]MDL9946622.1 LuxR C-terminal-related transcriptional regulator [Gordonia sp. ABSL11-1]
MPDTPMTGSPVPGSPVPGSPVPGSPVTGSPVTGSPAPDRAALDRIVRDLGVPGSALDCALIVGPPGTGRSTILRAVAEQLRDNGVRVIVGVPADVPAPSVQQPRRPIVVADDLHTWPAELLDILARRLDDGSVGVVGVTENRDRDPAIADLISRARRSGTEVLRRPMSTGAVIDRAAAQGLSLDATTASHIRRRCAGASAVIDVVLGIVASGEDEGRSDDLGVGVDAGLGAGAGERTGTVLPVRDPIAIADRVARDHRHRVFRNLDDDTLAVLALASSRAALDPVSVSATLEITADDAASALDRARGSGFLGGSDVFPAGAIETLCEVVGPERLAGLSRRAVRVRLRFGAPSVDDALRAVGAGIVDPIVVETLCAAARDSEPSRAAALLEAAEAAGGDPAVLRPARARLALGGGDLPGAARLVDDLIAGVTEPTEHVADAIAVAAAVASASGRHTQAADLFRWLGPELVAGHRVAAVDALLTVGDRSGATTVGQPGRRPPTVTRFAEDAAITAVVTDDGGNAAVEELVRAWSSVGDPARLRELGWTSFALAVHSGDQVAAGSLADLIWGDTDDPHRALADAWTALCAGDVDAAAAEISTGPPTALPTVRLRQLAIALGVAGRTGDTAGLAAIWREAVPLIVSVEIGLADVTVLGELWLAAARIGDTARITRHVAAVDSLLDRLDDRTVWRPLWTWYALRAGLLAGDLAGADNRAGDLGALAARPGATRFVAVLSEAAAVSVAVAAGATYAAATPLSAQRITAAVAGLDAVGLRGDAGRLAADAAIRTDDTAVATTLLRTARSVGSDRAVTAGRRVGAPADDVDGPLTDREAEVARELLAGFTYREIGERLYISAKTVEHHVARIRRRLDAGSRSELLAAIRAAGYQ